MTRPPLPSPANPARYDGHGGEQSSSDGWSAEQMYAYYDLAAARIAELEAELEAVGAGGVQALSAAPAGWTPPAPVIFKFEKNKPKPDAYAAYTVGQLHEAYRAGIAVSPTPPALSAAPAVDIATVGELQAFEAWVKKDGGDLSTFGKPPNIHYCNSAVNNAWVAWKARAAVASLGGKE